MVSPNDRLLGQPINGSNDTNGLSSVSNIESVGSSRTADDINSIVINSLQLHRLLHRLSFVDSERQLFVGSESDGHQLCLGSVHLSTQRRSVTKELVVVANGLKPVKGSANKFSVNQIIENKQTIGCYRTESVIEFSQSRDNYPISSDTNIVATGPQSQLFVKDDQQLIEIRSKDGFVLIDSDLTIFDNSEDTDLFNMKTYHYNNHQKGNLFVLGNGIHLIIIDKNKRNESILLVGTGGMTVHSSNNQSTDHKSSDKCVDRPIILKKSSFNSAKLNGKQNSNKTSNDCKRHLSESDTKSKKQKCEEWSHSHPFVDSTQT